MENIINKLENIKSKIEMVGDNKYKEIFDSIFEVLSDLAYSNSEVILKQESLEEYMGYIGEDLTDIQEELFEEVSIDDLNELEDEYVEINCMNCHKPIFVEKSSIDNNTSIPCPFCNKFAK